MFLPTTKEELKKLGWNELDVILVSGDCYIDSPFIGVAVIGKVLLNAGYKVGIIAQPDVNSAKDIMRLGEPRLFWGVSAGAIDSMVSNRTASGKQRRQDDYTPGGVNDKRPDRATIAYTNLIRRFRTDNTKPIVLGGMEASLRRIAHYDFWTNKVRRSLLFDAKADYLLYGMAERSSLELANALKDGNSPDNIRGLCRIAKTMPEGFLELPSYEDTESNTDAFIEAFKIFYDNNDPLSAKGLAQRHGDRILVQNPPSEYLTGKELDEVYNLRYEREAHPYYLKQGAVKALETIRFAVSTHRGCYGECNFCAIAVHEGRRVRSRSKDSILKEVKEIAQHPLFKGRLHDVGGPTANMYGSTCAKMETKGVCSDKGCVAPKICPALKYTHGTQISLLTEIRKIEGVKKVVIASGIRYDMVLEDKKDGERYVKELAEHYVSGQLKIAPEHSEENVLRLMNKQGCGKEATKKFKKLFDRYSKEAGLKQFLSYYLIAGHPGCTESDMKKLKEFAEKELGVLPEQVQVFTPAPSTYSTLMYATGKDPFTGKSCFVEKSDAGREKQKRVITGFETKAAHSGYKRKGR